MNETAPTVNETPVVVNEGPGWKVLADPDAKPVLDAEILNHPALHVALLTIGGSCVAYVLGGSKLASDVTVLIPGVALVLFAGRRLAPLLGAPAAPRAADRPDILGTQGAKRSDPARR